MVLQNDGPIQVFKIPDMGSFNNNGYILADELSKECYLVDAPGEIERLLAAATGFVIKGILITHSHPDHIASYTKLRGMNLFEISIHGEDEGRLPNPVDSYLHHNQTLFLGTESLQVLHTPGHTPGSICLVGQDFLISGDTLFPGGPGYTRSIEAFNSIVESIEGQLYSLNPDIIVMPGHGANTTIRRSKSEFEVFKSQYPSKDLYGEIRWVR